MLPETRPLPPGPLPLIGQSFRIVRLLGRIGDGLVYAAEEASRSVRLREYCPRGIVRRVADGTLHPAQAHFAAAWEDAMARFLDQGHRLSAARPPGTAPIWRAVAIEAQGVRQGAYTVGNPVGEPLTAALDRGIYFSSADILRIGGQLAAALAELHGRGLTHLDVSPATVSIASGAVELSDPAVDNRPFMALLETQADFVRPGYSPLEHYDAAGAGPLTPAADVYAGSALLFRLVTDREPPPWQERWRQPDAVDLDDNGAFPPAFLQAIRTGLAIEPEDRFPDAGAWRAAMGLPDYAPQAVVARQPTAAAVPAPLPRRSSSLLPVLLLLLLVAIGAAGYIAYRYFAPDPDSNVMIDTRGRNRPDPDNRQKPRPDEGPPRIVPGNLIAGQLATTDRRRPNGEYEDIFRIVGRAGDRIELRLSSSEFDPALLVTGPDFSEGNDDDPETGSRNSRLVISLPRSGEYQVAVTSYAAGETGSYYLQVEEPEAPPPFEDTNLTAQPPGSAEVHTLDLATASALAGRWHAANDSDCRNPAVNRVDGDQLVSTVGATSYPHRILRTEGGTVQTQVIGGSLSGRSFVFRLAPGGDSYTIEDETWIRC